MRRTADNQKWLVLFMLLALRLGAQQPDERTNDLPEYERLGLSLTEWNMILQNKMPMERVKSFLRDGISISEYYRAPWKELGISESRWIANRRRGQSDDDMRAKCRKASVGEWAVIQNFFVPGLHQWLRHDYVKASAMSGIAVGSLALYGFVRDTKSNPNSKGFDYPFPFLFFLAGDMLWSSLDIGLTVKRESNPDATRFSAITTGRGGVGISYRRSF